MVQYADIPHSLTFYILLSLFALMASIFLLTRKKRNLILTFQYFCFGLLLCLFLTIYSNKRILPKRLTFTASIGFIATLTFLYFNLKKISPYLLIGISFLFSIITYTEIQNGIGRTSFTADMPYLENSAKANTTFATFLLNNVNTNAKNNLRISNSTIDSIIFHYKKAIDIYPNYYAAMNNLGLVYFHYKKIDSLASYWFNRAIEIKPHYSEAIYNLSKVKLRQKDTIVCIQLLKKSLLNDSTNIYMLNDLVNLYFSQHKKDSAVIYNNKILLTDTNTDIPYINLGNFALFEKDTSSAVKQWEIAIQKNANNIPLIYGLSRYFRQNKNENKALYYENLMFQQQRKQINHSKP
jgi:tetratricopeptide (TPR) repeat protein